ncbi:Hsp20/alpha crystallin family protein [Calidifontibacillus erzurumensis]|uniref:Hsp20/alpha crystallin family protein n=1 Tax=Calidifontibacillus erzurumensis TaxID=2741433 RepID=UPI0035B54B7C
MGNYNQSFWPMMRGVHELFNHFFDDPFMELFHQPFRVDVYDMGEKIVVEAELPGFDRNQIKIEAVHEGLKICAIDQQEIETVNDNKKYFKKERSFRKFERIIPLPYEVSSNTKAYYKNGILEIHVPKNEGLKQRYINIE